MKAFLTGGTGFVGSHLAEELLRRGYSVSAMVRSDPKWLASLDVDRASCNLRDVETLCSALEGSEFVFHVAGMTRARTRTELFDANVEGTVTLLNAVRRAAPGVRRIVVTSSQAAVGPSPIEDGIPRPLTEADPLRPLSTYGESKAEMELVIAEEFGDLPITIIRPPAVYGPREADIYTVIRTASRLRVFPIVGDAALPGLSLVHVSDLVRGIVDAAEEEKAKGETFFVSSEHGYSWEHIRDAVARGLGKRLVTVRVPRSVVAPLATVVETSAGLFGRYPALNREKAREAAEAWICSTEKARQAFGYEPKVPLDDGMAETIAWYRQEGWL